MRHIDPSPFPKQAFRPLWRAGVALLLGIAAFCTVAVVTVSPGPGLDPDALSYLGAAESLVARGAYRIPVTSWAAADSTEPLVHFPPGFPTLIAGPVALGMPAVQAGRLVECVSAFVAVALAFLIIETTTGAFAGFVAVVALFATPAILGVYMSVVSEPPFIAALLATLGALVAQRRLPLDSRARRMAVVGAGLAAAAAITLRYAGVAVVGAAALWPLATGAPWRRRLSDAAIAIAPAALCSGLWVYRIHRIATGPAGNIRTFRFYGGVRESVLAALATLCGVVLPGFHLGTPTVGFVVFAGVASFAVVWLVGLEVHAALRGPATVGAGVVIEAAALLGVCYVTVLLVSRAVADPGIPFDERILAPLVVLLILVVIEWICLESRAERRNTRSPLPMGLRPGSTGWLVGLVWLAAAGMQSAARASDARDDGLDIAEARFRTSETIGWVRANGSSYAIYTNWPSAIYFHAHRATHDLPATLDALTLRRFHDRLVRQHGIVVALDVPNQEMAPPDSLAAKIPLQLVARLPDGAIWGPIYGGDSPP
jgi:hypothetical protein